MREHPCTGDNRGQRWGQRIRIKKRRGFSDASGHVPRDTSHMPFTWEELGRDCFFLVRTV